MQWSGQQNEYHWEVLQHKENVNEERKQGHLQNNCIMGIYFVFCKR